MVMQGAGVTAAGATDCNGLNFAQFAIKIVPRAKTEQTGVCEQPVNVQQKQKHQTTEREIHEDDMIYLLPHIRQLVIIMVAPSIVLISIYDQFNGIFQNHTQTHHIFRFMIFKKSNF